MTPTIQELTKDRIKEIIAKRIAKEFKENDIITLGSTNLIKYTF